MNQTCSTDRTLKFRVWNLCREHTEDSKARESDTLATPHHQTPGRNRAVASCWGRLVISRWCRFYGMSRVCACCQYHLCLKFGTKDQFFNIQKQLLQILSLVFDFKPFVLAVFLNIMASHPQASFPRPFFNVESLVRAVGIMTSD